MFGGGDKDKKEEEAADGAAEEEEGEDESGKNVASMKDGEYILHVLVETGKSIFLEGEDTIDPMVKITFMGESKQTAAKEDVTRSQEVKWDEHIYIESGEVKGADFADELIEIRLLNKGFFKSDLIGYFPISPPTIYNMKDHVVHNQQIAFTSNEAEDKSKITAYLTVSINLSGPGDSAAQLK